MRKFLSKLIETVAFMKVLLMALGAFYAVFWMYRFFELPFYDYIALVLDFPNNLFPWPIETMSVYKGHVVQNAYFIDAVACAILSYIFTFVEKGAYEIKRRYEIMDVNKKRQLQDQMNKELEKEYLQSMNQYDFFSLYIKYKVRHISTILSANNPYTPEMILERSYNTTFDYIKKALPSVYVKQNKDSIFLYCRDFNSFDSVITKILSAIKSVKKNNANVFMETGFIITGDACNNQESAMASSKNLEILANCGYYNKAIVTTTFKTRFDLLKSEKFEVDILGFATNSVKLASDESDIYVLKSKPKQI